jgi:hypothetical protein
MNRLFRPDGPGDPNGSTMGLALLLVGLCSEIAHWMPLSINMMIVCLGLALIAGAFGAAALIKTPKFVVTGVAALAMMLFVSVQNLQCEDAACSCSGAAS